MAGGSSSSGARRHTRRLAQCKQEPRIGLLITLAGVLGMASGELLKPVEGHVLLVIAR